MPLFSLVKHPIDRDQSSIVRSLIFLRLSVLGLSLSLLGAVHLFYAPFDQWTFTAATWFVLVVALVCLWSLAVLRRPTLLPGGSSVLRELVIDYLWVFAVVMMTGRSANPFIYYYLVLTAVSATTLPMRQAWYLCVVGIGVYSGVLALDLTLHFHHLSTDYRLHLSGMWLHYVVSALVMCYFVTRLSKLLRSQQNDLNLAREENLKNEQLIGLATVAASTMHTLATPISTLAVLADDIISNSNADKALKEDAEIMRTQITRCRTIMDKLSLIAQQDTRKKRESIATLIEFLEQHYLLTQPDRVPHFRYEESVKSRYLQCNELLHYALINLINNALESGTDLPTVLLKSLDSQLTITIENESTLVQDEIISRWGKPTRSDKTMGLGIGSFLANSTIEKQGGKVQLETRAHGENTVIKVTVTFPLLTNYS